MFIADKATEQLYLTEGKIFKDKLYNVKFITDKILCCSLTKIKYDCKKLDIPFIKIGAGRRNFIKGENIPKLIQPTERQPGSK